MTYHTHAYDCRCQQCSAMAAAINARSPDGTFFFNDMPCEPIRMKDGTVVLANMKPRAKLTEKDKRSIAEWVQFCRDRRAKEVAKKRPR